MATVWPIRFHTLDIFIPLRDLELYGLSCYPSSGLEKIGGNIVDLNHGLEEDIRRLDTFHDCYMLNSNKPRRLDATGKRGPLWAATNYFKKVATCFCNSKRLQCPFSALAYAFIAFYFFPKSLSTALSDCM